MKVPISNRTFTITNGPSKDALFQAFRNSFPREKSVPLNFYIELCEVYVPEVEHRQTLEVAVHVELVSVRYADTTGTKLALMGFSTIRHDEKVLNHRFTAEYDCAKTSGSILFRSLSGKKDDNLALAEFR